MNDRLDRYKGCLIGLAIGDAVGTTLEFTTPGNFEPIDDMIGGGPFGLQPGQWTDDTSMALCLAQSLIDKNACDPYDQMIKYLKWYRTGYMSSKSECFDIGNRTVESLVHFEETGQAISDDQNRFGAGNGSIMRLASIPMMYAEDLQVAQEKAEMSSKTTHAAPQCVDSCKFMTYIMIKALAGESKTHLLQNHEQHFQEADAELLPIIRGSYLQKSPPEIVGSGYVIESLEAALWAFSKSNTFKEGCLLAANLGNDADTTAAVYGQIAGAYYGLTGIPSEWFDKLYMNKQIEEMAEKLFHLAQQKQNET